MRLFISNISNFFDWWFSTLLSCLPLSWITYFSKINKKIDLVIVHQGDTIFIQTQRGKIIDSVSLTSDVKEQQLNSNEENTVLIAENPKLQINSTALDFNLGGQDLNLNENKIDYELVDGVEEPENISWKEYLDDQTDVSKLNPVHITEGDDTTIYLDSDDRTTQYLEIDPDSDEDTIIIKNDQGQLLNINADDIDARDNTLVFRNEGGKIKLVVPSSIKPETEEITVSNIVPDNIQGDDSELQGFDVVGRLLAMYQGNKKCLYLLPDEKVFSVNLSYPIEAIQNIEKVLRYDLEKHIPLSFQEIRYFYALNVNSAKDKVDVEVAVIKSIEFDLLNSALESYIDKGLICTTKSFFEKFGRKINFVEKVAENSWGSIFSTSNIHLVFNSVLLLVLLVLPYFLYHQYNDALEVNSPQDMQKVQGIITSMNLLNTETKFGSKLSQKVKDVPRLIKILSIMSDNIDQQAWLSRYSFKNNELRIKGEAVSATAVSDGLSSTGLFESIKFVSSIIKNPRNDKETFELLLRLKSGA